MIQDYSVCPDFEGSRPGHAPHRVHPHSPFEAFSIWSYLMLPVEEKTLRFQ